MNLYRCWQPKLGQGPDDGLDMIQEFPSTAAERYVEIFEVQIGDYTTNQREVHVRHGNETTIWLVEVRMERSFQRGFRVMGSGREGSLG